MKNFHDAFTHLAHAPTNTHGKKNWNEFLDKLCVFYETPAPSLVELAKQRFLSDLERCHFSISACLTIYEFCQSVTQNIGDFSGSRLELLPYQVFIIANLYGLLIQSSSGSLRRKYREAIISVPRKNGKSTFIASLGLHALFEEPGAAVYLVAQSKAQAKEVFNIVCELVNRTPHLKNVLTSDKVHRGFNSSSIKYNDRRLQPLAANDLTLDGLNPSMVIYDEFFTTQDDRVYNVMRTSFQARRNPLMILMGSHSSYVDAFGFVFEHQKKEVFLKDDQMRTFLLVYEPDEDDDLHSPETWRKVNPAIGVIKDEDSFKDDYAEAVISEEAWEGFKAKLLNVWPTKSLESWLPDNWDERLDKIEKPTAGSECFVAIDLSYKWDLTAVTICTSEREMIWLYWVASDTIDDRVRYENPEWRDWVREGECFVCPGDHILIEQVWDDIDRYLKEHSLVLNKVVFDHYRARPLKALLVERGVTLGLFKMYPDKIENGVRAFYADYVRCVMKVKPNRITDLCMRHAVLRDTNDGFRFVKQGHRRNRLRIDGAVTAMMAWLSYREWAEERLVSMEPFV